MTIKKLKNLIIEEVSMKLADLSAPITYNLTPQKNTVLSCSLLNVCSINDQFKVNGHNCSSLSIFQVYFIDQI
jgi:hypothetical protein